VKDGRLDTVKPLGNEIIHPDATGNNDGTDGSTPSEGNFTFSRGSNLAATRVDVNGLIEKGRENLLLQSNQFDTTWSNVLGGSIISGQGGYDGSNDAWIITSSSPSSGRLSQGVSGSGVHTMSIYAKAGSTNWMRFYMVGSPIAQAWFDLENGQIGTKTATNIDTKIEAVGATGWYRCSITSNLSLIEMRIYPSSGDGEGGGIGSIYIQDCQVEKSLVATDYIETGASTAQAGILEDLPRLDYSGSCPALLLEPQRSNFIQHSEYALDSSWTTQKATLTANALTSPEGVDNAVKFLEDASTGRHRSYTLYNTPAGTHCVSVFMKDGNRGYGFLHWAMEGGDGRFSIVVDLSDGEVVDTMGFSGSEVIVDYGTEDYGNGWYRAYIVGTKASSNNSYANFGLASSDNDANNSGTPSYTGDGTHYAYFYGMQLETGSYPTSYIPTYGSAVTRSVDFAEAVFTENDIAPTGGTTLFIEFETSGEVDTTPNTGGFYLKNNAGTLGHWGMSFGYGDRIYSNYKNGSTIQWDGATPENTLCKVAFQLVNGGKSFLNGTTKATTSVDWSTRQLGQLELQYGTRVKQAVLFPTILTDSECIALTTI
jgi:hypothetical protein